MLVVADPSGLPPAAQRRALVPTLGNLHRGHMSLVEAARGLADEVVVSLFVNPTQFRAGEDYDRYPRTPDQDLALCEAAGVSYVFMPTRETMYPDGETAVTIHVGKVGDKWEGALRPGHFDGVATVVANLFLAVRPHYAVFGQKDLQQNAVIRRLALGLRLGVELHIEPTIRDADGLALSSRNSYLSREDRQLAPQLYQALCAAKAELTQQPNRDADKILTAATEQICSRFTVQYLALVNRETMESTTPDDRNSSLIIAAVLGNTRLIDNIPLYD
jgi:pantoate--beta-alanine ligase